MNTSHSAVYTYFEKLGFDTPIADIYSCLIAKGPQTLSQLSRNSGVERTLIYRLLPTLTASGLIETKTEYKHGVITAAPFSNLQILLSKREQELEDIKTAMPLIEQTLVQAAAQTPETKVQFYRGDDGVKQMLWNETKASSTVKGILYENIQVKTNSKFFERWVEKCNDSHIQFQGIISDSFVTSQDSWYAGHINEQLEHWESRYVSPRTFEISHSTVVYDDVVAHFNWSESEVFGVEIYNKQIADTQRQLFALLWNVANPQA